MEKDFNKFEEIVIDVLSNMGSCTGRARSEDLLFREVLDKHKNLIDNQAEIREAISNLVRKGIIVHDKYPDYWIHL